MYFEKHHSYTQRHKWTFSFTGETLAPMAEALHTIFKEDEVEARQLTAQLLQDPTIHHENQQVIQGRNDIVKYGKLREKCAVWTYEFARQPYREYALGIGDVAFFDDAREVEAECVSNRDTWKYHYAGEELIKPIDEKIQSLINEATFLEGETRIEIITEAETLRVLLNQFKRQPATGCILSLGDVVYFELAPLLKG